MVRNGALADFVASVGKRLGRPRDEVLPYADKLADNWYDSPESLADAKADELTGIGIPLRFAKELINDAKSGGHADAGGKSAGKASSSAAKSRRPLSPPPLKRINAAPSQTPLPEPSKGKGKAREEERPSGSSRSGNPEEKIRLRRLDPRFDLKGKIIGLKGQNMKFIATETGAKVFVNGENTDEMSVVLLGSSRWCVQEAVSKMNDLISTVYKDYETWARENGGYDDRGDRGGKGGKGDYKGGDDRGKGKKGDKDKGKGRDSDKGKGKGKDKGKEGGRYRESIPLDDVDEVFDLRNKVLGDRGVNLFHIQDETGAQLFIATEQDGRLRLDISADERGRLDAAINLAQELIDSVYNQYYDWLDKGKGRGERRGGKGDKDKGKGKSKSKGKKGYDDRGGAEGRYRGSVDVPIKAEFGFHLRGKIVGLHGANLRHIEEETGVTVRCYPDQKKTPPTHVEVSGDSQQAVDQAVQLVRDLIDSVVAEFEQWKADGGGNGGGSGGDQMQDEAGDAVVEVTALEREFGVKKRLVGHNESHLKYIEEENPGVRLRVQGEDGVALRVSFSGGTPEATDSARNMLEDLLDSVYKDYEDWQAKRGDGKKTGPSSQKRPAEKGRGKGDAPNAKRRRE
eukprot:TRINITY_DN1956_c0_g1_i2.p1 TRINITY_DN1956_c0_g1~~TRINITY_DN1956_c0_g1_i2.p1  ORF type:complete len:626 (-),score=174.44 TRINITY_DN1956_c0_g1_i2:76-1953(-)